jgi:hypothetical protein
LSWDWLQRGCGVSINIVYTAPWRKILIYIIILLIKYFFTVVAVYRIGHLDITLISTIAAESRNSYFSIRNRR